MSEDVHLHEAIVHIHKFAESTDCEYCKTWAGLIVDAINALITLSGISKRWKKECEAFTPTRIKLHKMVEIAEEARASER